VISIQTIAGHVLFACTVGDLGNGVGDVSLDSWACLEGMINTVKRTGHSSFYVEKGMSALGKSTTMGMPGESPPVNGGGRFISSFSPHNILNFIDSISDLGGGSIVFKTLDTEDIHERVRTRLVAQLQWLPVTQDHRKKITQ